MITTLHYTLILAVIAFILVTVACKPQDAFAYSEAPKPPVKKLTDDRLYGVTFNWEPNPIYSYPHYNGTTTFSIEIVDRFGEPAANRAYSVTLKNTDSIVIKEFNNAMTDESGKGAPLDIQFQDAGPSTVFVCIPAGPSSQRVSCAFFNIVVIPEFLTSFQAPQDRARKHF